MLFRSEEDVQAWCERRNLPIGGMISLETAWRLAKTWYHDRLERSWRRKTREEIEQIFAELGMVSSFWALGD